MFELKIPPLFLAVIIAVMMIVYFFIRIDWPVIDPVRIAAGVVLSAAGLAVMFTGAATFRRHDTTFNPRNPHEASLVVSTGIYGRTRNPMYLGMLTGLSGLAIVLGGVVVWSGPLVYLLWITFFQIIPEERAMEKNFGADYLDYKKRVRRWI